MLNLMVGSWRTNKGNYETKKPATNYQIRRSEWTRIKWQIPNPLTVI